MKVNYLKMAKPIRESDVKALRQAVEGIIDTVRKDGDAALAHFAKTFDDFAGSGSDESANRKILGL